MSYTESVRDKATSDLAASLGEIRQSTFQSSVFIVGGIGLAWQFIAALSSPTRQALKLAPGTWTLVAVCVAGVWLAPRCLLGAQFVWQAGLAVVIAVSMYASQEAGLALGYILLPLMAMLTVGWPSALLAEGLVVVSVWWLASQGGMPPLSTTHSLAIILGGAISGLLGWTGARTLLAVAQWSLFSYEQARVAVEEARDQRLELKQVQQDLVHANRELARLTDRLEVLRRIAEEARRAKEEFVANVSHELRTPLNMIIGFSELIAYSPQVYGDRLPPALLADIAAIQRNSQHLAKLVDDVLDLSQVEAGRMALSKEWVSIGRLVHEVTVAVRGLFESKGLSLEAEVDAHLPQAHCDRTRIRQVLINLVSNAGRFTDEGGVRIRAWRGKDQVVVSVTDTGPGIPAEDQERIFEPFQQLDNSIRREHGGSGLGLSISKRFVEMHGGSMTLKSVLGAGTTITFTLPVDAPVAATLNRSDDPRRWFGPYVQYEPRARRPSIPPAVVGPRYIVVEEGETLQRLLRRYMQGFEILSVRDVESAIREAKRSPATAIITNASQPTWVSSLEVEPQELPYGTPVMTCWIAGNDEAARRLGVVRYLVKPVTRETLLSALEGVGSNVKSVLLVDDDAETLQLFTRMLSSPQDNYDILQAKNGRRALSLLRRRHPDVILLDLIMPDMDGFQVLRQKSEDPAVRDIPVIVVSSRDPSGDPIVSRRLAVTCSGGMSVRSLLACVQAVSGILSPSNRSAAQAHEGTPGA